MKAQFRHDVDPTFGQTSQLALQAQPVEEVSTLVEPDEQVEVAVRCDLATPDGTEITNITGPMLPCQPKDLFPAAANHLLYAKARSRG